MEPLARGRHQPDALRGHRRSSRTRSRWRAITAAAVVPTTANPRASQALCHAVSSPRRTDTMTVGTTMRVVRAARVAA